LLAVVACAAWCASPVLAAGKNLVQNPGFEKGSKVGPDAWARPDNLTIFWEGGGVKGKCIRMDTDVYRKEWEEHRKHPDKPMKKTPTSGTRYNTVGGTCGVALYSAPIPVEEDAWYMVGYDIKAPGGEPFVFVKGYWRCEEDDVGRFGKDMIFFDPIPGGPSFSLAVAGTSAEEKTKRQPAAGDYIQCYRGRCVCRYPPGEKGTWRHYERAIQLKRRLHADVVLIELYAFWPVGDYSWDNITFRKITEAEAEAYQERRKKLGKEANFGTPVKGGGKKKRR